MAKELTVEPQCDHSFEMIEPPVDTRLRWVRCTKCSVHGFCRGSAFRKTLPDRLKVKLYTCSTPGCKRLAVRRIHGRGPRGSYKWACRMCVYRVEVARA